MGGRSRPFSIYILPDVRYAHLGLDISLIRYVCGQEGMYIISNAPRAYIEFAKQVYRRALPYIDNPCLHRFPLLSIDRAALPSCQSTEPLSPLVIPTERSERRDLGTDSHAQEISPLGRLRFLGRNDRRAFLPPPFPQGNGGGGILPSGQNAEGGGSSHAREGESRFPF